MLIPYYIINIDNIFVFCKYGIKHSLFKQNHMERNIKIGIAILLFGTLIPLFICLIWGTPNTSNSVIDNIIVTVGIFSLSGKCKAKTFAELPLQGVQMFIAGVILSGIILNSIFTSQNYLFYFAASGYTLGIAISLAANAYTAKYKKSSIT
jgi:hypothetical protein